MLRGRTCKHSLKYPLGAPGSTGTSRRTDEMRQFLLASRSARQLFDGSRQVFSLHRRVRSTRLQGSIHETGRAGRRAGVASTCRQCKCFVEYTGDRRARQRPGWSCTILSSIAASDPSADADRRSGRTRIPALPCPVLSRNGYPLSAPALRHTSKHRRTAHARTVDPGGASMGETERKAAAAQG